MIYCWHTLRLICKRYHKSSAHKVPADRLARGLSPLSWNFGPSSSPISPKLVARLPPFSWLAAAAPQSPYSQCGAHRIAATARLRRGQISGPIRDHYCAFPTVRRYVRPRATSESQRFSLLAQRVELLVVFSRLTDFGTAGPAGLLFRLLIIFLIVVVVGSFVSLRALLTTILLWGVR